MDTHTDAIAKDIQASSSFQKPLVQEKMSPFSFRLRTYSTSTSAST